MSSLWNFPEGVRIHLNRQRFSGVIVCTMIYFDGSKSCLMFIEQIAKENSRIYQKMLERSCCLGCPQHLDFAMSYLDEKFLHIPSIWRWTGGSDISGDFLTNHFGLHQCMTLIMMTLRYDPFWNAMSYVSRTQVKKQLLRCPDKMWGKRWWKSHIRRD